MLRHWIVRFGLLMLALVVPGLAQKAAETDCTTCHDQGQKVAKSAHAKVGCASCHLKHETYPHPANTPKPDCVTCHASEVGDYKLSVHGQAAMKGNGAAPDCAMCHGAAHEVVATKTGEFHKNVPDTCGMCHGEISEQYKQSVHGKAVARGVTDAPVCSDCHGEHSILSPKNQASSVSPGHVPETCGRCHNDVRLAKRFGLPPDRITSFESSFHGLAMKSGSQTVANCASCHGIHNILPSNDAKSMVSTANLSNTCGKCHPGAGSRFALGKVHWVEGSNEPVPVQWVRLAYLLIIPMTIGFMLLHHGGDFIRKLWRLRLSRKVMLVGPKPMRSPEIRMMPFERVQHALLVVSFIVLAWSGFALKYPDQWWAKPLVFRELAYPVRGLIHRVAAVIMVLVSLAHVISLLTNKRLRDHWKSMIPVKSDLYELLGVFFYNLGLRKTRPLVGSHTYVEKIEYWAVVWGTFIMGLTGFMLWANNYTLRLIPKEWLDAATAVHFYEAALASLAILIWHFYTVIFDPDVYPMDPAWLSGKSVRHRHEHHKTKPGAVAPESEAKPEQASGD